MIVSLFILYNYILGLIKSIYETKKDDLNIQSFSDITTDLKNITFHGFAEITESNVQFFPPAYIQRYQAVTNVIQIYKKYRSIKKIVDFGCAELAFFIYAKQIEGIEEYIGVDIDKELIQRAYTRAVPLTADHLKKRSAPLKVSILRGSVTDADSRLRDSNVVVAIELIEHMYPNELNDLPRNIFDVVKPGLAVFTTPNAEFNVVFPKLEGFRHPDHKFEWTRQEFEDWAKNIVLRFPSYTVLFYGIGKGPEWTERYGCCSQMAIFVKNNGQVTYTHELLSDLYEPIYEIEYPFETYEQHLKNTFDYEFYNFLSTTSKSEEYVVGERKEIPLSELLERLHLNCSLEELLALLTSNNNKVEYINDSATLILPFRYLSDDESSVSSLADDSLSENESDIVNFSSQQEFWDIDCVNDLAVSAPGLNYCSSADSKVTDLKMESEGPDDRGTDNISGKVICTEKTNDDKKCESEPLHDEGEMSDRTGVISSDVIAGSSFNYEFEKFKASGAIPKRHLSSSEFCDSFSLVNSGRVETSVGLVKSAGMVNLHQNNSFLSSFSDDSEPSSQDLVLEHTPRSNPSPSKYPSTDFINIFNVHSSLKSGNNNEDFVEVAGCSGLSSSPESHEKRTIVEIKSSQCSLMQLNNHNCSEARIQSINNVLITPEKSQTDVKNSSPENTEQTNSIHRSHSLGNINDINGKCKYFRYSLNIDNKDLDCDTAVVDMDLEVCCKVSSVPSLSDTFGSQSKAPDSGYPNSVHDMDLDLTPEQVDEIITETESSLEDEDSSADERAEQQMLGNAPLVFLDNVENGDVANNNRDGEGNNMEGGDNMEEGAVVEQVLGFEGIVIEGGDAEADHQNSDDEGLYLSALDVSNETLMADDISSDAFNCFDGYSSHSIYSDEVHSTDENQFPPWLLNILLHDVHLDVASQLPSINDPVEIQSRPDLIFEELDVEVQVELIVPGDVLGGGDAVNS